MSSKILIVADNYVGPGAGTERQLFNLVLGLQEKGFEPLLAVFRTTPYIEQGTFPCPVRNLDIPRLTSPGAQWRLVRAARDARREGFRIAHLFFNDTALVCPWLFRFAGLRVITSRRDMGIWYSPLRLAILRTNVPATDAWVVNSRAVGEVVEVRERVPREKVRVIYNGCELSRRSPSTPDGMQWLDRLGARRLIVLVANLRPIKRIQDLIRAFGTLANEFPDVDVVVAGHGDSAPLVEIARESGVAERVHFPGSVANVPALLSRATIGAICSESEGLSNSLIEYMLAGLPVVASDVGGNSELLRNVGAGSLYAVGDTLALAVVLRKYLLDPGSARSAGDASREFAQRAFAVSSMVDAHIDLYRELLGIQPQR